MSYIFSFSSRNSAFRFIDAISAQGGVAKFVNVPIGKSMGCGLAVKCCDYNLCQRVLDCGHYVNLKRILSYDGKEYKTIYDVSN